MRDGDVGTEMEGWLSQSVMVTVKALSSPQWSIRNSANLLFSSLVSRLLGAKHNQFINSDDFSFDFASRSLTSIQRAKSFSQLFSRFVELHPFLLKEISSYNDPSSSSSSSSSSSIVQTSLFSILVLISRLSPFRSIKNDLKNEDPKTKSDEERNQVPPDPFREVVQKAMEHNDYRTREMAAKAFVPLTDMKDLVSLISTSLEEVELSLSSGAKEKIILTNNQLHGRLLKVFYLLKLNISFISEDKETQKELEEQKVFDLLTKTCLNVAVAFPHSRVLLRVLVDCLSCLNVLLILRLLTPSLATSLSQCLSTLSLHFFGLFFPSTPSSSSPSLRIMDSTCRQHFVKVCLFFFSLFFLSSSS